jgi:hypothetical protein
MKALPRPYASYHRDLSAVLTSSERRRFAVGVRRAREQAALYARRSPDLRSIACTLSSDVAKNFFRNLYDTGRKATLDIFERVRAKLDDTTRARCQYCGLARPRTLDHYLEKAPVPELSIYARNLVPCCHECNNTKRTFDANGMRQVLHFYDDDVDALPELLTVTFVFNHGVPVAQFAVPPSLDDAHELYRRHFYALKLDERYAEEASALLRVARQSALQQQLDTSGLQNLLRGQARALWIERGRNECEAALYEAAAGDAQVLHWMRQP